MSSEIWFGVNDMNIIVSQFEKMDQSTHVYRGQMTFLFIAAKWKSHFICYHKI